MTPDNDNTTPTNVLTKKLNIYSQGIVFFTKESDIKDASWYEEFIFLVSGITDINLPNTFKKISDQTPSSTNLNFKSLYISHFYSRPFPIITINNYSEEHFLKHELSTVFQLLKRKELNIETNDNEKNENPWNYFFIFEKKLNKISIEKFPSSFRNHDKIHHFIFENI